MNEFVIFFENGNSVIIRADIIIDSDNYINFYNHANGIELTKDMLVAQFAKNKVAGYGRQSVVKEVHV